MNYDDEGQCAAGVTVRYGEGIVRVAAEYS